MEEGLNNANNPFGVANGATTDNIITQKPDGLLLNLSDKFKQNGTDLSPPLEFFERSNGKRTASEFEDDDFGPETDIDAVDDMLSPGPKDGVPKSFADCFPSPNNNPLLEEGVFNPFMEHQEKAALEMEKHMRKRETKDEFNDEERLAREETPTPPADAVHDVSGLVENPADSESEDEWNYIKGEEANKENLSPQPEKEVADIPEEDDNMSGLNPNAAEFVPVSPTRSIPSPACRMLINDPIVSQSPKKANDIDINLPNPKDFEKEVKSRPSEVDPCNNGHNEDDDLNTSKELMENILNGKNIDEIPEFQPGSTPKKMFQNEEFHFGPNAAPFTPKRLDQSEALSTKAVFGDESVATVDTSFNDSVNQELNILNKESDPMSMSFYADKGETNPFDLNKVQQLPENLDDFLNQDSDLLNETISDLPEHSPLEDAGKSNILNNDDAIQITDLDKHTYDDEKELASPLEPEKELLSTEETDFSKTPEPTHENLFEEFCKLPEKSKGDLNVSSTQDSSEVCDLLASSPENLPPDVELLPHIDVPKSEISKLTDSSVETFNLPPEPKPLFDTDSLVLCDSSSNLDPPKSDLICDLSATDDLQDAVSPVCDKSEQLHLSLEPQLIPDLLQVVESTICDRPESKSSVCDLSESKSPIPEEPMSAGSEDFTRPEFVQEANDRFEELCKPLESPQDDITSSVKDDLSEEYAGDDSFVAKSPSHNLVIEDSFVEEVSSTVNSAEVEKPQVLEQEFIPDKIVDEAQALEQEAIQNQVVEETYVIQQKTFDQLVEGIPPTDSPTDEPLLNMEIPPPKLCICPPRRPKVEEEELIIPFEVKTENISLEFAEPAVISPSEESKAEEIIADNLEATKEPLDDGHKLALELEAEMTAIGISSTIATGAAIAAVLTKPPDSKTDDPKVNDLKPDDAKLDDKIKPGSAKKTPLKTPNKSLSVPAKSSSKSSAAPKSPAASKSPAAPPKPSPRVGSATTPKPMAKLSPKSGSAKPTTTTTTLKPSTATSLKSSPRAPISKTAVTAKTQPAPKPAIKLTNGDVKLSAKPLTSRRTTQDATSKITAKPATSTTATSKVNQIKPARVSPPFATTKTTIPPRSAAPSSARPAPIAKRPATLNKLTTVTTDKVPTTGAPKLSAIKAPPKPATLVPSKPRTLTSTAPPKPKPPQTKTITKAQPDTEKQIKESANKITASRNITQRIGSATAKTTTTTTTSVRKVDAKVNSARTTVTKSTTSTTKTAVNKKKPMEITKPTAIKAKTTKIEKPKENGISTVVTEEINVSNTLIQPELININNILENQQHGLINVDNQEPGLIKDITKIDDNQHQDSELIKDNSPVDNKIIETQLVHTNAD